jgi:hypothetical protein
MLPISLAPITAPYQYNDCSLVSLTEPYSYCSVPDRVGGRLLTSIPEALPLRQTQPPHRPLVAEVRTASRLNRARDTLDAAPRALAPVAILVSERALMLCLD